MNEYAEQLKLCPFCGCVAYVGRHGHVKKTVRSNPKTDKLEMVDAYIIRCAGDGTDCFFASSGAITEEEIPKYVKLWNTRKQ